MTAVIVQEYAKELIFVTSALFNSETANVADFLTTATATQRVKSTQQTDGSLLLEAYNSSATLQGPWYSEFYLKPTIPIGEKVRKITVKFRGKVTIGSGSYTYFNFIIRCSESITDTAYVQLTIGSVNKIGISYDLTSSSCYGVTPGTTTYGAWALVSPSLTMFDPTQLNEYEIQMICSRSNAETESIQLVLLVNGSVVYISDVFKNSDVDFRDAVKLMMLTGNYGGSKIQLYKLVLKEG